MNMKGETFLKRWWLIPVTAGLLALIWALLPFLSKPTATRIEYHVIDDNLEITATFNQDIETASIDATPCDINQGRTVVCVVPIDEQAPFKGTIYVETANGVQGTLVLEEQGHN